MGQGDSLKRLVYLKLFFFSVLGALALSSISLFCLIRISDMVAGDYRYGYLLYIAKTIERSADFQPVNEINVSELPAPVPPKEDTLSLVKITEFGQASIQESRPLSKRLIPNFI